MLLFVYNDQSMCSNYLVKLFWREGPDSEEVQQLNATTKLTLEDFEKYWTLITDLISD